jgi:hypothetical protein
MGAPAFQLPAVHVKRALASVALAAQPAACRSCSRSMLRTGAAHWLLLACRLLASSHTTGLAVTLLLLSCCPAGLRPLSRPTPSCAQPRSSRAQPRRKHQLAWHSTTGGGHAIRRPSCCMERRSVHLCVAKGMLLLTACPSCCRSLPVPAAAHCSYPSQILPGLLYLGNWTHAQDLERLQELNVRR